MNNAQTFSKASDQYAKSRPQYPDELFAYLSELCTAHDSAWDCATGNGQAAISLTKYFSQVEATDISAEQIEHSIPHPRVRYRVCPAEQTPFADQSFDLITVATAAHWFDLPSFFHEAERVLKPGGVLAIWSYGHLQIEPEIQEVMTNELLGSIDRFWAAGNRQVMNGYRDLRLPFDEISDLPSFVLKLEWDLRLFSAYMRTWSAVKRYTVEYGIDPVERFERRVKTVWGEPDTIKTIHMPLFLRVSRKPGEISET